jgi:protein involved in polysaccharide export with SLBB domain
LNHKIFLPFIIISFLSLQINAQIFPDYNELPGADSLLESHSIFSEGSIDPGEYIISSGDQIFISISGIDELNLNLKVNQELQLYIPRVGVVDLKNATLLRAKEKILASINKYYKDVDVFISLSSFSQIKIALIGDVKNPSSYVLPGNARLVDLISLSGGRQESSTLRNIRVINKNGNANYYDLLKYMRFGSKEENPLLREGDVVLIDKVDKTVTISGNIKFPGVYEYKDGESVSEFIQLSGGFTTRARLDSIEVVSFDEAGFKQFSKYYSYNELVNNEVKLNYFDRVLVREIPEYFIDHFVQVTGYVRYPGYYKIIKDKTMLTDIINEAGGFREHASLTEASLVRTVGETVEFDPEYERLKLIPRADMTEDEYDYLKAKSRQRAGKVIIDFYALFKRNDLSEDIVLRRGDKISIPEAKNYITMLGQVVNPGNIIYKEGLTVEDYIELAGGFGWRALEGDVRVIKAKTGEWIDEDDLESLEPGDTIWIPEDPPGPKFWDVFTTSLTVLGQVAAIVAATIAVIIATR